MPFNVTELKISPTENRLFFSSGNAKIVQANGVFNLLGPDMEAEEVITVYAMVRSSIPLVGMYHI